MDTEYMFDDETVTAEDWELACELEPSDLQDLDYYLDEEE